MFLFFTCKMHCNESVVCLQGVILHGITIITQQCNNCYMCVFVTDKPYIYLLNIIYETVVQNNIYDDEICDSDMFFRTLF